MTQYLILSRIAKREILCAMVLWSSTLQSRPPTLTRRWTTPSSMTAECTLTFPNLWHPCGVGTAPAGEAWPYKTQVVGGGGVSPFHVVVWIVCGPPVDVGSVWWVRRLDFLGGGGPRRSGGGRGRGGFGHRGDRESIKPTLQLKPGISGHGSRNDSKYVVLLVTLMHSLLRPF